MHVKNFVLLLLVSFSIPAHLFAQTETYLRAEAGVTWNDYAHNNPNIRGNEQVANIFWDNDFSGALLAGIRFKSKLTVETGFRYHFFANRYHLNYDGLSFGGSATRYPDLGFYEVPANIKYRVEEVLPHLSLVPYAGFSISGHFKNTGVYESWYEIDYEAQGNPPTLVSEDTIAFVEAYRPATNDVLLNAGLGLEYSIFPRMIVTLYGNYTMGFDVMNQLRLAVFTPDETDKGYVSYKGTKFFLSAGLKIPLQAPAPRKKTSRGR